jgi:hypothetical protein
MTMVGSSISVRRFLVRTFGVLLGGCVGFAGTIAIWFLWGALAGQFNVHSVDLWLLAAIAATVVGGIVAWKVMP